ncbi:hypothetical protein [Dankookia sp. P2]|uniref:hypothetical protein n=1 Tax=Dankookia sp. P2 TaxID=3423955 RepID=UPI003D6734E9
MPDAACGGRRRLLRDHDLVALEIVAADRPELGLRASRGAGRGDRWQRRILLLGSERLLRLPPTRSSPELVSLDGEVPLPRIARLRLGLARPGAGGRHRGAAAAAGGDRRPGEAPRGDRRPARAVADRLARPAQRHGGRGPRRHRPRRHAAHPAGGGERDIGFLLPLFAFAGLEKVVMRQAQVLRARGWRTRLVVAGALRMDWGRRSPPQLRQRHAVPAGLGEDRLGSTPAISAASPPAWGPIRRRRMRLDLLAQCDAVVNTHAVGCHAGRAAAAARGQGLRRAAPQVERTPWDEPHGNPHALAAYEHA